MSNIPTAHNSAKAGDFAKNRTDARRSIESKIHCRDVSRESETGNCSQKHVWIYRNLQRKRDFRYGRRHGYAFRRNLSYELLLSHDVDQIIRIGSAGALQDHLKLMDVVIGMGACTDSNYVYQYGLPGTFAPIADYDLLNRAVETAKRQGTNVVVGNVLSSDVFYNANPNVNDLWRSMGVLAVEMEAAALYMNAAKAGKKALCMLTISDHLYTNEFLSAEDRQLGFGKMMEIALELA